MGRAFFTSAYRTASPAPAVQIHDHKAESAPSNPIQPSRWADSRFDPDADAFFDSDDAVYDAFLTPEEALDRAQQHAAADIAEARAARYVRTPSESSSSDDSEGSDGTDSGRVSPVDAQIGGPVPTTSSTEAVHRQPYVLSTTRTDFITPSESARFDRAFDNWMDPASIVPVPPPGAPIEPYTTPSFIRATPTTPAHHAAPATPRSASSPYVMASPSPAPSVTPHMYRWLQPVPNPLFASPTRERNTLAGLGMGPLPNAGARLSRTHVAPAIMAVPQVIG
jgi:hypothetical protein